MFFNYEYKQIDNVQVHTTGCESSMYDAINFALNLDEKSIVFNTCSFLEDREKESQILSELLINTFKDQKIYIMGCDVSNNYDYYKKYKNIYKNNEITKFISKCNDKKLNEKIINLKIQDGCHNHCNYCIINKLRSNPYIIPYSEIKKRLTNLMGEEIVLHICGTEVCEYYDKETNYRFSDIINQLLIDFKNIKKIFIPELDPISHEIEKVINLMDKHRDKIIPMIILAAQSGSNEILKLMGRKHTAERLRELHNYAKDKNVILGWDIICGYPGESDEYYNQTLNLVKELKPLTENIFPYSPRKGTPAYSLKQISEDIKIKRTNELLNLTKSYLNNSSNEIKNIYSLYFKSLSKDISINSLTYKDIILNKDNKILNILNLDELSNFILSYKDYNSNIHINYSEENDFKLLCYLNFLKTFKNVSNIIIHNINENNKYFSFIKENYISKYFSNNNILYLL